MTPLLAALSRLAHAVRMASVTAATSPASAASRNLRTAVFSDDLTALLRWRAFSFCLMRLIWDLMFATRKPRSGFWSGRVGAGASSHTPQRHTPQRGAYVPTTQDIPIPAAGSNHAAQRPRLAA